MTTTHLRFDNEEVNEIQDLLESCGNDETMDIGVIDGFFTALSVLKNPRPDEAVIPYLFGARAHVGTRAIECLPFDSFGYAHLDEAELV